MGRAETIRQIKMKPNPIQQPSDYGSDRLWPSWLNRIVEWWDGDGNLPTNNPGTGSIPKPEEPETPKLSFRPIIEKYPIGTRFKYMGVDMCVMRYDLCPFEIYIICDYFDKNGVVHGYAFTCDMLDKMKDE